MDRPKASFSGATLNRPLIVSAYPIAPDRCAAILGDEVYEQLKEAGDLSDEQVESLGLLKGEWMTLGEEARRTANAMAQAAGEADMYGLDALWEVLANTSQEMRQLADDFDAGTIDGETFRTKLDELQRSARTAFDTLDDADKVNFSGAISEVERLGGVVAAVAGKVSQLYGWLKAAAGMGDSVALDDDRGAAIREASAGSLANSSHLAPKASERPRARPFELGVPDPDTGKGGGGGGGGGRSGDDYAEAIAQIERETAALQTETTAYLEAAAAGQQFGDMVEYARTKAELMTAAQEAGKEITPELTAEIEAQARAYALAGAEAEAAADRMKEVEKASERGADAIGGIFVAALDGADAAKKAVADLIGEIARMMMMRGAIQLIEGMGGGGFLSAVGSLTGARASGGGVQRGGAYLVNEGTPRSEVFVPSQNGAILNVQQAQAALRGQSGGQQSVKVDVNVQPSPLFEVAVEKKSREVTQAGLAQYERGEADRIRRYTGDPRRRK